MQNAALTFPKPAELLPHRSPILLIDQITDYVAGVSLTAAKHVGEDEPFFAGHFPGHPILPGVLLVEMMFQACGLFGRLEAESSTADGEQNKSGRAIKINNASFHQEVRPDTHLTIFVEFKHKVMSFSTYDAKVTAGTVVVAKGTVTVSLV